MNSSGIKRGLATTAVSALAVAGIPFIATSASALPMAEQFTAADDLALYTASNGVTEVGVRNDGANNSVHLLASGGSSVAQVRFYYTFNGTDTPIATVSRDNGAFSAEWTPAVNLYGQSVVLHAQALSNAGANIGTVQDAAVTVDANDPTVDISNAPGSAVGIFDAEYTGATGNWGIVSGTTSDLTNPVSLQDQQDGLNDPIAVSAGTLGVYGEPANGIRTFKGIVNFDRTGGADYPFDTTDPKVDQAVVQAVVANNDDNEVLSVYSQRIDGVTATAANANPPASNPNTTVTVKVVDQNGAAIAGAEVVQTGGDTKYSNANGEARFTVAGDADGNTYTYTVNVDDEDGYQPAKDFQRTVTVQTYSDTAGAITANSSDLGDALDFGEYAADPVSITVTDNQNTPRNNQTVSYSWSVDPFNEALPVAPAGTGTVQTGTDGTADIPAPSGTIPGVYTLNTYIEQDGNPGQSAGDLQSTPLVVKLGQATIVFSDGATAQAPAGSSDTVNAVLQLEDKTPLAGREVTFSYTPGTETGGGNGDSFVSATQPAGTERISNNSAKDVTDANGVVSIGLTDPAETPQLDELNAALDADTSGTAADAAAGATPLDVDWLVKPNPTTADDITVNVQNLIDAMRTPGRPVDLDITVENEDGTALTDYPIEISVNKGFLSPNAETAADLKADPAPAEGGLYGEWKSDGTSKTFTTDDAGTTGTVVAIEKDAGFDTDDEVVTTVTITAGSVTKTVPITFTSEAPLNGGDVQFELDDVQSVTVLPKAPTTESVNYNLFVTDQFGNLVEGESVEVSDDLANAFVNGSDGPVSVLSQLKNDAAAIALTSDVEGDQTLTGEWTTDSNTWTDGNTVTEGFQATRDQDINDTELEATSSAVQWYAIDYAASSYTLTQEGPQRVPVGTTVIMTYSAVDQNGEPIDFFVDFFRTGPDDLQGGEPNSQNVRTGADGQAQYVFAGTKEGTATITAIASETANSEVIPGSQVSDTVEFGGTVGPEEPKAVTALIAGDDNGGRKDVIRFQVDEEAATATVRLFKIKGKGDNRRLQQVRQTTVPEGGELTFKVADRNGNRVTRFIAKVSATDATLKAKSNTQKIR